MWGFVSSSSCMTVSANNCFIYKRGSSELHKKAREKCAIQYVQGIDSQSMSLQWSQNIFIWALEVQIHLFTALLNFLNKPLFGGLPTDYVWFCKRYTKFGFGLLDLVFWLGISIRERLQSSMLFKNEIHCTWGWVRKPGSAIFIGNVTGNVNVLKISF